MRSLLNRIGTRASVALLLRVGVALCFIGHGIFGILRKPAWLDYFALIGIPELAAHRLMPVVGTVDIIVGILALAFPARAVFGYAAFWALFTALLRPLNGEGVWEALERAGNYGVPLALLLWVGWTPGQRSLFGRLSTESYSVDRMRPVLVACAWTTALLLVGHGMLAIESRPLLVEHLASIGIAAGFTPAFGLAELALAAMCILRPSAMVFIGTAAWKLATEGLFIVSGAPVWEFVERGGSYMAPMAAALILSSRTRAAEVISMAGARRVILEPLDVAHGVGGHAGERSGVRAHPGRHGWIAFVLLAGAPWIAGTASAQLPPADSAVIAELREGGLVLYCRHAETNHEAVGERLLNEAGERQARAIGLAIRALGIRIADVHSSPYNRNIRSAELSFGKPEVYRSLLAGANGAPEARRALLTRAVTRPGNRAIVTHERTIMEDVPEAKRGMIGEGTCVVIRQGGRTGYTAVALVTASQWDELARRYAGRR